MSWMLIEKDEDGEGGTERGRERHEERERMMEKREEREILRMK